MKTASIIASLSRNAGGLFESVRRLHQSLAEFPDLRVTVLGLRDEFTEADLAAWSPLNVRAFVTRGPRQFGYAPRLAPALLEQDEDILHMHGIWQYPSVVATRWHRKTGRPYLISPHGMLDPWAVRNAAWKKRIAHWAYEGEHLRQAACLRALCESEAQAFRAYGLTNPICIIPNGIDLPPDGGRRTEDGGQGGKSNIQHPTSNTDWKRGRKMLLYLGRIHPKKGLVNLLRAWAAVQRTEDGRPKAEEWVLAIAGWDQGGHEAELKALATELGIEWADARGQRPEDGGRRAENLQPSTFNLQPAASLLFLGPQFGDAKAACYRDCDAFILPSFSEGLPMVVLEAWAYGKPVLMTPECNLPEGFAANAAIRIEQLPDDGRRTADGRPSIEAGLTELFRLPASDLYALGANGRALVASRFTWPKVAAEMKSVYEWVLGGGPKPECVVLD